MSWDAIIKLSGQMLGTLETTLALFALTIVFAIPLGMLVALARMSSKPWINIPIKVYLVVMRGTPLILQLMFFFFAPHYIIGYTFPRLTAAVISFTLNYAAYFAEIFRSGIESIPVGQREAGQVLGFGKVRIFFKIILPQVVKRILPPMSNEFMTLVKDTALAQVIGVAEMYQMATSNMSRTSSIIPLVIAGVFYLIMNTIVSKLFGIGEKKLSFYR